MVNDKDSKGYKIFNLVLYSYIYIYEKSNNDIQVNA